MSRPGNANAGKCVWAFAEKDGESYFIKEFLDPKRPREDGIGTPADKRRRLGECARFEQRHERMMTLLRADDLFAGNLVLATDFFAEGTRYYKITRRIDAVDADPHTLGRREQAVLLHTLADSVRLLHDRDIVHGDLKPDNVLLHRPERSRFHVTKLIDFDDAYPAGEPPARDIIGGSPSYGAPEWLRYMWGDSSVREGDLTQATDMFSFGLLVHTYLVGAPPDHDAAFDSPAAAVAAGAELTFSPHLDTQTTRLLRALIDPDPAARPSVAEATRVLDGFGDHAPDEPAPRGSRVRINLTGRTPLAGGLRINLSGPSTGERMTEPR
ncbi:protein kinase [Amycolatopsis sp. 195334CR]|uniref:protein kinase domain-containing protein n=1 Tax=Amycolatopsis sp. 195334CR TaxID=2814588 RepID=UPI0027DE0E15|nr:protein kinase [Amycolatopsis sp. 195334CR]